MRTIVPAALALSVAGLLAGIAPAEAAGVRLFGSVGQHRTVMNNIARAQRRNNAVINSVQRNIRSSQRDRF